MSWDELIRSELEGLTPYTAGLRASQVRQRSGKERIFKLSSNEHPCGPFPSALAAIRKVAARVNRYPDGASAALRERLAEHWGVPSGAIAVGNGSNEILRLIAQAVLRPGNEVVYAWPSFIVYPMVTAIFGAVSVRIPLTEDQEHDLDAMLDAITDRTRLLFLCNPNNPTGAIYREDAFGRFMERVPEHVLVVVDEAYFEFVTDPDYPDGLQWFDGERPFAITRTFSKMYSLAGLRVGYGIVPAPLAEALAKVREPFNVSIPAQIAAAYSLDDPQEVVRRRAENDGLRCSFGGLMEELGIEHVPSQANFVYIGTERPREVFETLLDEGVIVRDFGTAPALRVTMGTPEDMDHVEEAFRRTMERLEGI